MGEEILKLRGSNSHFGGKKRVINHRKFQAKKKVPIRLLNAR